MQRVPLDTLILQMVSMGLPDVRKFPFVEAPPPEAIENAVLVVNLQELYKNVRLFVDKHI